jgi:cardiolipin synthase
VYNYLIIKYIVFYHYKGEVNTELVIDDIIIQNIRLIIEILAVSFVLNIPLCFILVFYERRNPTVTWAWLMLLIFFPFIGFIIYILFGQNYRKNKRLRLKKVEDRFHRKAALQEQKLDHNKMVFHDPEIEKYQDNIHLHLAGSEALFTQDNLVEVYISGDQKFPSLLKCLESAQKYIHIEYYIFRSDKIGKQIIRVLEKKAAEGIEVKMLYDAIGGINLSDIFFKRLKKNGGKVVSFFPSFLYYFNLRINYRNHRKIAIIDGREAFVGGFNVGDEYLGRSKRFGFWRDTHLKIMGSAVNGLQRQFILDWRFASKHKMKYDEKEYFPTRKPLGKTGIQIVASGPDSKWTSIKDGYFKIINSSQKRIYMQTPYFIPDESIFQALKVAALSGIDVRIMIPDKPDQIFVYWASYSYIGDLLESGARCYTYNKGFIHSKMLVSDGITGSVGTANVDIRSFQLNFEINAFIYDTDVAGQLEKNFINDITDCTEITLEIYNRRSLNIKIKESFSRLLSSLL